ncbi:MAG: MFS transporter [Syntrophales bacterium]|nr:MFS transporter [Syntrophales bacterium]
MKKTALLRDRPFSLFFFSRAVSLLGDAVHQIALMILVYDWTRSTTALGRALFFLYAPKIIFGLLSGPVADHWNRKKIMVAADLYRAAAVAAIPFLPSIEYLYLVMITLSAAESFYNTARVCLLPSLLKDEDKLTAGNSLLQTATTTMMILGPVIGGAIVAARGTTAAFMLDALTFLLAAILIVVMRTPDQGTAGRWSGFSGALRDIVYGFRYIVHDRTVFFITLVNGLIIGSIFLTSSLTIVVAERIIAPEGYNGAKVFSYIIAASGIGSLCGGLLLPFLARRFPAKTLIIVGFLISSLELFCFALSGSLYVILFAVTISNVSFVLASVSSTTQLQVMIKEEFRGRVFALYGVILSVIVSVAVMAGGWLCDTVGLRFVYLSAGFTCVSTAAAAWLFAGFKNMAGK